MQTYDWLMLGALTTCCQHSRYLWRLAGMFCTVAPRGKTQLNFSSETQQSFGEHNNLLENTTIFFRTQRNFLIHNNRFRSTIKFSDTQTQTHTYKVGVLAQRSRTQWKRNATPHLKIRSCVTLSLCAFACGQNPHFICVCARSASAAPEPCELCARQIRERCARAVWAVCAPDPRAPRQSRVSCVRQRRGCVLVKFGEKAGPEKLQRP